MQDRGNVKMTQIDVQSAEYLSLDRVESSLSAVQKAYWDLVLAKEEVLIETEMVESAKRLYELHQEQLENGRFVELCIVSETEHTTYNLHTDSLVKFEVVI